MQTIAEKIKAWRVCAVWKQKGVCVLCGRRRVCVCCVEAEELCDALLHTHAQHATELEPWLKEIKDQVTETRHAVNSKTIRS